MLGESRNDLFQDCDSPDSPQTGAWLVLFVSFGYVNSFGVFQEYYLLCKPALWSSSLPDTEPFRTDYLPEKSSSDLAWVGSFQLFLVFFMSFFAGKLFDEGYFRYLLGV